MDYESMLNGLRNNKNQTVENIRDLENSELEELTEAKRRIEEKYSILKKESINELDKKMMEVYNYCKIIEKNSTLNRKIFDIITELITIFEGENYILKQLKYHKDSSTPSEVYEAYMIIPKSIYEKIKNPNYLSETYYYHLLKNNLALKLIEDWSLYNLPYEFSFYKTDDMGRIIPQISFKGFPYIKQFVDYVINYRIENNLDKLSIDKMEKLKEEFILLNLENIENNYDLKKSEKIKQNNESISSEYAHKKDVLKRLVKKIEQKF